MSGAVDGWVLHTDICHPTFSTTTVLWKLGHDAKRVRQLRFAAPVLAVDLVDAHGLEAAVEDAIPGLAAGGEAEAALADLQHLGARHKSAFVGLQ